MKEKEVDVKFPVKYTIEYLDRSIMYHIDSINAHGYIVIDELDTEESIDKKLNKAIQISVLSYLNVKTDIVIDKDRLLNDYIGK